MATTLPIAFLAGFISFLSPCVLPLIPGYISYISGTSFDKLVEKKNNLIVIKTVFFTLGFSFLFIYWIILVIKARGHVVFINTLLVY